MLPGMKDDLPCGGFEIVIGASTFAERRTAILDVWKQNNLAIKGLHVTDRNQIVGPAELPDGVPLTLEMRQAIAAARAQVGKSLTTRDANGSITFNTVDYLKDDAELDGIVAKPDWAAIGAKIDARLKEITYVPTKELECPGPELATQLNDGFIALLEEDDAQACRIIQDYVAYRVAEVSKLYTVLPPERDPAQPAVIDPLKTPGWFTRTVTFTTNIRELSEAGITLRKWVDSHIRLDITDTLDRKFRDLVEAKAAVWERGRTARTDADKFGLPNSAALGFDPGSVRWCVDALRAPQFDAPDGSVRFVPSMIPFGDNRTLLAHGISSQRPASRLVEPEVPYAIEIAHTPLTGEIRIRATVNLGISIKSDFTLYFLTDARLEGDL